MCKRVHKAEEDKSWFIAYERGEIISTFYDKMEKQDRLNHRAIASDVSENTNILHVSDENEVSYKVIARNTSE